jgi:hypothetical protein
MFTERELFDLQPPARFDGVWDFDVLEGCFPRGITPTDLDGMVEVNGRFLVFETKLPGTEMPEGQERALRALVATGLFTVLFLQGKPGVTDIEGLQVWRWKDGRFEQREIWPPTVSALRRLCERWAKWAALQRSKPHGN